MAKKKVVPEAPDTAERAATGSDMSTFEQAKDVLSGGVTSYVPVHEGIEIMDLLGRNNPRRLRGGTSNGAKPMLRRILGTSDSNGAYPSFSIEDLVRLTGKGDANVRTCLSDLRSTTYCGKEGVFFTKCTKVASVAVYTYDPVASEPVMI